MTNRIDDSQRVKLQLLSEIPNQFEAYVDEKLKTQLHPLNPFIFEKSGIDQPMDTHLKRTDDTFQLSMEISLFSWDLAFHHW